MEASIDRTGDAVAALARAVESRRKLASAHKRRYSDDPAIREAYIQRRRDWDRQLNARIRDDPERLERKRAYHRAWYHRNKARKASADRPAEASKRASPNNAVHALPSARAATEATAESEVRLTASEALATDI